MDSTIINNSTEDLNLSRRVIRSGVWVFATRLVYQVFFFIRLIVLARLLTPRDFGLMGIAMLVLTILDTFTQTGFHSALIQRKSIDQKYLNTGWTASIARGLALFALIMIFAPLVSRFFNEIGVTILIRLIAFSYLATSFSNIGIIFFNKNLEFKNQFLYQSIGSLFDLVVSIIFALILRNALALVLGYLAGNIVKLVLSYALHPYRPKIQWDSHRTKELFRFGRWVLWSKILVYLITQLDSIFLGKLFGAKTLGYYQLGNRLSNTPTTEITHVISSVAFPAYVKIQENQEKLREGYKRVMHLVSFLSFPLSAVLFMLVGDFTILFLGEKWAPLVPITKVLVIGGLFRSLSASSGSVLYAVGKPRLDTLWQMARLLVLVVFIIPLTLSWQIIGTAISVVLSNLVASVGLNYHVIKTIRIDFRILLKLVMIPSLGSALMIFTMFIIKQIQMPKMVSFLTCLGGAGLVYAFYALFADRVFKYGIMMMLNNMIISIKKT